MSKATTILNQVKTLLGMEVKLAQMMLEDGITQIEAEAFEPTYSVGIVTPEGVIPLPVGEYKLEDGRILVVEQEGIILEIKEEATEEAMPEGQHPAAEATEPQMEMEQAPQAKKIVESVVKESFFSAQIEELQKEITELKAQLASKDEKKEEVAEEVELSVKPLAFNPEPSKSEVNFKIGKSKSNDIMSRVLEQINK